MDGVLDGRDRWLVPLSLWGDMKSASLAGFDADFATETKALGETVERL